VINPERRWPRRTEAERARRREVEACLARWRLASRPRPVDRKGRETEESLGRRLRGALEELGPVCAAFGRYLASRVDLLPASDCLELARIQARAAPWPAAAVSRQIASELGERGEELLAALEPEPFESTLLVQSHRARLAGGQPVIVHVVRPEVVETLDLALLPALAESLAAYGVPFGQAVADFRLDLEQSSDLRAAATALDMLAVDAEAFGRLVVPAVDHSLSTSRVLVHTDLEGTALDDPLWSAGLPAGGLDEVTAVARQVCVVWFRQSLFGRLFPHELRGGAVRVLPGGRIGWQGIAFVRVPAAVQANLRSFVLGVAARDPDEACAALIREMAREDGAASEEELLLHLRQIVPFRDGAWSAGGESLAEHAFAYARIARAQGYRASVPALAFLRGLFAIALACREMEPVGDPLADGLQELRLLIGFSQVSGAIRPDQWNGQLDRYAMLMAMLPQRLDELLARAAEGDRYTVPEASARPRAGGSSQVLFAAMALVVAALALLLRHLVAAGVLAGMGEKGAAVLFLVCGGLLLWAAGGRGGT
jgi:predicted unusual protein kinase regulating ubiquinone biosynthesis (AarF/ABC1/UbiB family)